MQFPLTLTFRFFSLAQEISVLDATGALVMFVKQKAFKLKEDIRVSEDREQTRLLYTIKADRVIDFSAKYHFADASGNSVGMVKREGMRSLWKASYQIDGGSSTLSVSEANPWLKVADALFEEIPIVGMFSGYLFHPAYNLTRADGTHIVTLKKVPSITERRYEIHAHESLDDDTEVRAVLGLLTVCLLERSRG